MRIALIPGSFDPVHNGHLEVIERASRLFDEVVVAALRNPQKNEALFDLGERQEMLEESLAHLVNVRIVSVSTLVVNVASEVGASVIVKGLRAVSDFENELQMAQMNKQLSGVETMFIPTSSAHSFIASASPSGGRALRRRRHVLRAEGGGTSDCRRSSPMSDVFEDLDSDRNVGHHHDAEAFIRSALDLVQTAKAMPLSASVLVSREELVDLLQAALDRMPDELREARWLLKEREEFLADRTREADALLEEVRVQAERMVQRTEIVRQANHVAQRILDDANEEARRLRHEAEDYADHKLASFEIVLDRTMKTVQAGRQKLQVTPLPRVEIGDQGDTTLAAFAEGDPESGDEPEGFFDQDLA